MKLKPKTNTKARVVLAGGSGFLGKHLAQTLVERSYEVIVLTRTPETYTGVGKAIGWDGKTYHESWARHLEGADALVNLAGKNVNCRQTKANRAKILRSRVDAVEALGDALLKTYHPPEVWVQAGSLAIYGNAGDKICNEAAFVPDEYPTDVCVASEEALGKAIRPEMRWAMLRIGFVLGKNGGGLPTLAGLTRAGLGGNIGSGKQWISWIHIDDMMKLFLDAIQNPATHGIYNATGMQPVTNTEFMKTLRETLGVPFGLPTPAPLVRLASPLLGADPDLALNGRRGLPARIHGEGFHFRFHELAGALADLLRRPEREPKRTWVKTLAR